MEASRGAVPPAEAEGDLVAAAVEASDLVRTAGTELRADCRKLQPTKRIVSSLPAQRLALQMLAPYALQTAEQLTLDKHTFYVHVSVMDGSGQLTAVPLSLHAELIYADGSQINLPEASAGVGTYDHHAS